MHRSTPASQLDPIVLPSVQQRAATAEPWLGGGGGTAGSPARQHHHQPITLPASPSLRGMQTNRSSELGGTASRSRSPSPDASGMLKKTLEMEGLELPPPPFGTKSLDTFDDHQPYVKGMILIDSPRSVEACLRLGIAPVELLKSQVAVPVGTDADVAKMRFLHAERRRRQKLRALQDERIAVMQEQADHHHHHQTGATGPTTALSPMGRSGSPNRKSKSGGFGQALTATMLQDEEKRLQRILAANQSQLKKHLLYEERIRFKAQEREARLATQRQRDDARRDRAEHEKRVREAEQELMQRQLQEQRELERREQADQVRHRQQLYEETDRQHRTQIEQRAREVELANLRSRETTHLRQQHIKEISLNILEERRAMYEEKQRRADDSRREFEEYREELRNQQRKKAEMKERRIHEALSRGQEIEAYKIALALSKQEKAEESRQRFEEERQRLNEIKRQVEWEREVKRQEAYQQAKDEELLRVEQLVRRQEMAEEHRRRTEEQKRREKLLRNEDARLKAADKAENVLRMKRIVEYQKYRTLERIEQKLEKCEQLESQKEEIKLRGKRQREEIERNKVFFVATTPGPGEYVGLDAGAVERKGPAWKFGLPRDQRRDVGSPELAKGFLGIESPGPGAYVVPEPKLSKGPRFGRASRFDDPSTQQQQQQQQQQQRRSPATSLNASLSG